MAKPTWKEMTAEDFEAAHLRGLQSDVREARATAARYDDESQAIVLTLRGGLTLFVPVHLLQRVAGKSVEHIREVEVRADGSALHWETLDADFGVQDIVAGSFGMRSWMQHLEDHNLLDEASIARRRDVDHLLEMEKRTT